MNVTSHIECFSPKLRQVFLSRLCAMYFITCLYFLSTGYSKLILGPH